MLTGPGQVTPPVRDPAPPQRRPQPAPSDPAPSEAGPEAAPPQPAPDHARADEALQHAKELEQTLVFAEEGWRQSLLELRARIERHEQRLGLADESARGVETELERQRDHLGRENEALIAAMRTLTARLEQVEAQLPDLRALPTRVDAAEAALSELPTRVDGVEADLAGLLPRVDRIEADLPDLGPLTGGLEQVQRQLAEVGGRIEAVERELGGIARRAEMGDELARALSEYGRRPELRPAETELPDAGDAPTSVAKLNRASFEELRAVGLSVTQAARLIAVRDAQRGFRSVGDLDSVPGLPEGTVAELRRAFETEN